MVILEQALYTLKSLFIVSELAVTNTNVLGLISLFLLGY